MARFNELFQRLGLNARLHNRYRHATKGQMVQGVQDQTFLRQHAKNTMSCSGPGKYRFHPDESMRRLAALRTLRTLSDSTCIVAARFRFGGDVTPYTFNDLTARVFDSGKAEGERIRAFKLALARLAARPARARRDIHVPGLSTIRVTSMPTKRSTSRACTRSTAC